MKTQMLPKEFIKMQKVAGLITESQLEEAFDFFKKKKSEPHTITLPKWQGKDNVTFTNSGEPYVSSDYVEFGRVGNGIDTIIFYYKTIGDKQNAAVYTGSNKQIYQLDPAESRRLISRYFSSNKNESQLEEVQSEYYQELVNNWKSDGVDYEAAVVELERMGLDTGTAENIVTQIYGEEPEELSEEKTPQAYYILNGDSKIDTKNPTSNELVDGWNKSGDNSTYLLLDLQGRKFIVVGGGKGYGDVGEVVYLFDDGNQTTKFPSSYDLVRRKQKLFFQGVPAKVIAKAYGSEEIKNFPQGKYQLYVMK